MTAASAEPESSPTVVSSALRASPGLRSHWVIIVAGFAVHAAATFFWLREGGFFDRPPTQDSAWSRLEAYVILQGAKDGGLAGLLAAAYRFAPAYHPPLNPLVLALVAYVTGMPLEGATIFVPTFLYGLLFLCASGLLIGHLVRPEQRRFAALIVVCAPGFIVYLRPGFAQLPMVALSLLTAGLLLTSDWLERWPRVILASLTAALAVFTKNLGPMEVGGFCLAYLAMTIARRRMTAGRLLARVAVFLVPIVALNLPWYVSHLDTILKYKEEITGSKGQAIWSDGIPLTSVQRWVALPWYFCRFCVGTPAAVAALVLAAAGAANLVRTRAGPLSSLWPDGKGLVCLLAGVAVSYVVMTFGQVHADAHFIVHWIPVYAIVLAPIAYAASPRAGVALRTLLVAVSATLGALCYVPFQKGDVLLGVGGVPIIEHQDARMFGKAAREAGGRPRPDPERWPLDRLVEESSRWNRGAHVLIGVLSLDDLPSPYFLRTNVVFEAMRRGLDVDLKELEIKDRPIAEAVAQISSCNVLLIDSKLGSASDIELVLRGKGFRLEPILEMPVTERYRFLVYGLRRQS